MSVTITKSAINIREKLSELDKPSGIAGEAVLRADSVQEIRSQIGAGRKNLIINGGMRVDQRNSGAATTITSSSAGFPVDRFNMSITSGSSGTLTTQQVSDAPQGFDKSLKLTVGTADASLAAADWFDGLYNIEGNDMAHLNWGTANAQAVTLSFWVKASVLGTYSIELRTTSGTQHSYTFDYAVANTGWNKIVQHIAGPTVGTFNTNEGSGVAILIPLATGSNYTTTTTGVWQTGNYNATPNAINFMATSGNTWQITGLQLELGSVATDFEHRSYGEELALCQRYYQRSKNFVGSGGSSTTVEGYHWFSIEMRATPALSQSAPFSVNDVNNNFTQSGNNLATYNATTNGSFITMALFSGITPNRPCASRGLGGDIIADAEIY